LVAQLPLRGYECGAERLMSIEKRLTEIAEQDLLALVPAGIREGKTIEYKEKLVIGTDEQKRKFVASVASLANASGGDLIFGIKADKGVPLGVEPLPDFEPDRDIRILRDIVRAHIDPPVYGVEFKEIPVQGGMALIVRVPRTWDGAHMVTYNNDNRFYTRDANGRVLMNVPEIRSSFTTREVLAERIRRFRLERLGLIRSNELPVGAQDGAKLVLHLFPLQSFEPGSHVDPAPVLKAGDFTPIQCHSHSPVHDLDGVYIAEKDEDGLCRAYTAILRNGCLEVLQRFGRDQWIPNPGLEVLMVEYLSKSTNCLRTLGVSPPVVIMVSLLDVEGYTLCCGMRFMVGPRRIRQKALILHDVLIQDFDTQPEQTLRSLGDAIWQSCGMMRSFNFDEAGKWMPQKWG